LLPDQVINFQHGVAICGEFRPHGCVHLGSKFAQRIEHAVEAGFEHPLQPAIAQRKARSPSFTVTVTDSITIDRFMSHTPLTARLAGAG
jgi:hypothetical protein